MTTHEPVASTRTADAIIAGLIARGVAHFVVCPGSRSQALALAVAAAERRGTAQLHVAIDERSAGFFALGVAHETDMPAAVIVTSGTAVANLAPATLEAHEGRVPLLLLTADRPEELHDIRANQATRQADVFARWARLSENVAPEEIPSDRLLDRVVSACVGARGALPAGPVQLNVQLRDPLSGGESSLAVSDPAPMTWEAHSGDKTVAGDVYELDHSAYTVVIAGADAGAEAEAFAHEAGLPLLAEVVSGARYGREAITAYHTLLQRPELAGLIQRVIVFGHPTLVRSVPELIRRDDVHTIVVDPYASDGTPAYNPGRNATLVSAVKLSETYDRRAMHDWLGAWIVPDRQLRRERSTIHEPNLEAALATGYKERNEYARAELEVMREPVGRELLVDTAWRASWPHDRLVIAASRLVRVLDGLAEPRPVKVIANRGQAGIDGTIATALGVAAAQQHSDDPRHAAGVTRVICGDLALLHDVGSLLLAPGEAKPRIQVIVGNDRGGSIFDLLEVRDRADARDFERVQRTPHDVDLEALARAYGWEYRCARTRSEYEQLFTEPVNGAMLVEVPLGAGPDVDEDTTD